MERWSGVLRVSLNPNTRVYFNVAASLCFSPSSNSLIVPSANAIFFNGDRVEGTGNPVIEKLSNTQNIVDLLVSKLGVSVNAWVIEASTYNGPFAIYKEFLHSVSSWGEPISYDPNGFPACTSTSALLSRCYEEAKKVLSGAEQEPSQAGVTPSCRDQPKTILLGFSKGGTVLNQLVTELAYSNLDTAGTQLVGKSGEGNILEHQEENHIVPLSKENLLNSISEIHYVDVGLNSTGAYLTNASVVQRITDLVAQGHSCTRFVLHGTPRQWCDTRRPWIRDEKDKMLQLLEDAAQKDSKGRLQVCSRMYFTDEPPSMQMHFEIIEKLDLS